MHVLKENVKGLAMCLDHSHSKVRVTNLMNPRDLYVSWLTVMMAGDAHPPTLHLKCQWAREWTNKGLPAQSKLSIPKLLNVLKLPLIKNKTFLSLFSWLVQSTPDYFFAASGPLWWAIIIIQCDWMMINHQDSIIPAFLSKHIIQIITFLWEASNSVHFDIFSCWHL